ncbi:MAG: membrane protein insertion efficiency factor YidD [Deltaproteobacteria bacterium]|jgi:putative membrane protein insertion efficiency factor|nr:membrane protein insertion efficiency factor YidD [Deltaproteobacteria bacterium]
MAAIRFYRLRLSPLKPPTCRFVPTCSAYALEAVQVHGLWKGLALAAWRILRCQPLCKGGYDPVPPPSPPPRKSPPSPGSGGPAAAPAASGRPHGAEDGRRLAPGPRPAGSKASGPWPAGSAGLRVPAPPKRRKGVKPSSRGPSGLPGTP